MTSADSAAASAPIAGEAPVIEARALVKDYPTPGGSLRILDGVDLALAAGEAVAVLGSSGSGKSTLLNLLGTLERATSGTLRLAGQDPSAMDETALAAFRAAHVGFVFQDHHLLPQCSVLENALLPLLAGGKPATTEDEARVRGLLERVGLGARLDHRPAELSGGERQRTAIVRALAARPRIVLADEPTGNLDRRTAQSVAGLLLELHRDLRTVLVVVTHSAELAAALPRRLELAEGKLGAG